MKKLKSFIKIIARNVLYKSKIAQTRQFRLLCTKKYSLGKIALGEKNSYAGIPLRWITIDLDSADFNINFLNFQKLPFSDNSINMIYSSHMIEHIPEKVLAHIINEAQRVLKKGGILRFDAPDAEKIYDSYKKGNYEFFSQLKSPHLIKKFSLPEEYISTHITFLGLFSCYIIDNNHIPVYATKDEIDKKAKELSLDDFGKWAVSLQTPEQYISGGHVNVIYYEKIKKMLEEKNRFSARRVNIGETIATDKSILKLERKHRADYS